MSRAQVVDLVRAGSRFLVTCHRRPDADALGSALGMAAILESCSKTAVVYCPDQIPPNLGFLVASATTVDRIDSNDRFDATFVMDAAAGELFPVPFPLRAVSGPVVVIDHHVAHDDAGDVVAREADACATGEIVLRMARDLGVDPVPARAALPLYAAIVADTGGFRYANTTATTLRVAAALLDRGVDPWEVAYNLFEGWSPARFALLREVLDTMVTELDGRLATLTVSRESMRAHGGDDHMVEGMVNYGRQLRGVEIAALLWERDPEGGRPVTRVSLRSRGNVDVAAVAIALGGGGHRDAAGAESRADLAATRELVVRLSARALGEP